MADAGSTPTILEAYDAAKSTLDGFAQKLKTLIRDILHDEGIVVHSVTSRVKARDSLQQKLLRPTAGYKRLEDITDVVGIRITTYLADDVDRVAAVIEREFDIDAQNSVDKRAILDPDQFGYLSLHHVVSLSPNRVALAEYRRFPGLKAEVQTRSILQHAWAEIEHDIGYKAGEVPRAIRRRFSRLAGLLEIADQEFCNIRSAVKDYERSVAEQISAAPESVPIDKTSLEAFIRKDKMVERLDAALASITGDEVTYSYLFSSDNPELFAGFGVRSIGELQSLLVEYEQQILSFAAGWLRKDEDEDVDDQREAEGVAAGISLFFLLYILAARTGDSDRVRQYLEDARIESAGNQEELAEQILLEYELIHRTN